MLKSRMLYSINVWGDEYKYIYHKKPLCKYLCLPLYTVEAQELTVEIDWPMTHTWIKRKGSMFKKNCFYWQNEIHIKKCYPYLFITHFISLLKHFSQVRTEPQPTFQTAKWVTYSRQCTEATVRHAGSIINKFTAISRDLNVILVKNHIPFKSLLTSLSTDNILLI